MEKVKFLQTDREFLVVAPYNTVFVQRAKQELQGKWDPSRGAWVFNKSRKGAVMALCKWLWSEEGEQ